mmetsp:Transcript_14448/g.21718  ORF Transcript_14448/g.21718 Transcript_14448/m.21718 type:complete len:368 (-) Transcript_14448:139-1242(-)|eukprot:CAMPEP_0185033844 /NCGR_PEP_ID=MMETSP1103-20130426/23213_1 /TAXON_ID=36769 /ORGANISM="Paraphysomonas bandaiensis, Strain Caron Lab Isolate" /LENGTH=367 /DNA_ID=CAMNT_0027570263 /DNA_START=17 /DNA_END=1120 /DNA_ORIENTATION=-
MTEYEKKDNEEDTSESSGHVCSRCSTSFTSRNKLFKHLRDCGSSHETGKKPKPQLLNDSNIPSNVRVYVVGGRLRGRTLSAVQRLSIGSGEWVSETPMLENRGSHGAVFLNGMLYAIGGGGLHSNLSTCEVYDGREWKLIAPSQISRHALSVTSYKNKIYAVGGWVDGTLCSGAVESYDTTPYDLAEPQWTVLPSLISARRLHGVAALKDRLYAFGGCLDDPHWHTDSAEVLDLAALEVAQDSNESNCQWRQLENRIPATGGVTAVALSPYIFLFLHGKYVARYDPEDDSYTRLSDLPVFDWHCFDATAISSTQIVLLGGAAGGKWSKVVYKYDAQNDTWEDMPSMKQAKRRCACAAVLGQFRSEQS